MYVYVRRYYMYRGYNTLDSAINNYYIGISSTSVVLAPKFNLQNSPWTHSLRIHDGIMSLQTIALDMMHDIKDLLISP